jgi:aspartate/methionine/tyrosine aminotransferase
VDSTRFCELLLEEFDTQVVDGRFFDLDSHIRISTALPVGELTEALNRLSSALDRFASPLSS